MSTANVPPTSTSEGHPAERFNGASREGGRILDSLPTDQRRQAIAVLCAMRALEREIAPLRPMGLADDRTIAARAGIAGHATLRALRVLRRAGYADSCLSDLRWSLTERGRKGSL